MPVECELPLPPEARALQAVAAIIISSDGLERRVYTIEETVDRTDYGKATGMRTIPMETANEGETKEETLRRLIDEEVGRGILEIRNIERIGIYGIGVAAATCFLVEVEVKNGQGSVDLGDVKDPRWMKVEDLMTSWTRRGVKEMLEDFCAGRRGVSRNSCCPVPLNRDGHNEFI